MGVRQDRRLFVGGLLAAFLAVALSGCGDSPTELVQNQTKVVQSRLSELAREIQAGRIRNTVIIRTYAQILDKSRPELRQLTAELAKEATTDGLAFRSLTGRLNNVKQNPASDEEADRTLEELLRIQAAADPVVYNDSLIDVINTLADLSKGDLARIEAPAGNAEAQQGAASNLIGNPAYGQWQRDASGNSFWAFYGRYSLMRDLFMPHRVYYGSWYAGRGWSYYGDVGRHYYAPRSDESRWRSAQRAQPNVQPRKTYRSLASERRLSTYGRTASRPPGAATRRVSSYSGYGSSVRGTSRSTRGTGFRGK